jgi:signal transduction histidine kinase
MIRWIQQKKWLPEILLALAVAFFFGGLDLLSQGPLALLSSAALALGFLFVRKFSYLIPIWLILGASLQVGFGLLPIIGNLAIPALAFVVGAFSNRPWRELNLVIGVFAGLLIAGDLAYNPALSLEAAGILQLSDIGRLVLFIVAGLLALSAITLAWLLGLLLITRLTHVGTDFDRFVSEEKQLKLSVELAEQAKRFEIAKDINELVIQKISGVISVAEGGAYAAKANSEAGIRALEKVLDGSKAAHSELRRLFDMLSKGKFSASRPPGIGDLGDLANTLRRSGLEVSIVENGQRFEVELEPSLAIYRIVFDALQNAKQHNPQGTRATVELSWFENGLQVMVKDNGVEVLRRADAGLDGIPEAYGLEEDLETLLEKVAGPGITAMKERAEAYGGSLEVNRVVGIGFTVTATFAKTEISKG